MLGAAAWFDRGTSSAPSVILEKRTEKMNCCVRRYVLVHHVRDAATMPWLALAAERPVMNTGGTHDLEQDRWKWHHRRDCLIAARCAVCLARNAVTFGKSWRNEKV